jgi:hypothetical protein
MYPYNDMVHEWSYNVSNGSVNPDVMTPNWSINSCLGIILIKTTQMVNFMFRLSTVGIN